jgi:HAD superfamily hydrolase (TIGR01549 family)
MKDMPARRFIYFDVGNTLLFPNRTRILEPLRKYGPGPSLVQWHAVECKIKPAFDQAVAENSKIDHSFWRKFYTQLFSDLGIAEQEALHNALLQNTHLSANWDQIRPGTDEMLQRIGEKYSLSIISNADGKIDDVLRRCGIVGHFNSITDSGIVGHEKPHPVIFAEALKKMQAPAAESLYVGDIYSIDYLGARNAGMDAVLFDVCGAYRDRGLPRVESLEELESWLAK